MAIHLCHGISVPDLDMSCMNSRQLSLSEVLRKVVVKRGGDVEYLWFSDHIKESSPQKGGGGGSPPPPSPFG